VIFLDTHVVVWLYAGMLDKLSKTAIEHIEQNTLMASQVVRLELQYLHEIGRLTVTADTVLTELRKSIGMKVSEDLTGSVFDNAIESDWTRDVFDRLIVAEAKTHKTTLLSKDRKILDHYTGAVW